jgi:N utilization substance protein B
LNSNNQSQPENHNHAPLSSGASSAPDQVGSENSASPASEGAKTPTPAKKRTGGKASARTRAREFAVQALYQFIVGKNVPGDVDLFTRGLSGFNKADSVHYDLLLYGVAEQSAALDALIEPLLDRPFAEISPIERSVMWIGAYELKHCIDVPCKVVINECIELAKEFGGTDGHKYVNAVLNGLAHQLRELEMQRR